MGHKVKQSLMSSRIDFFYYAFRNVLLVSIPLLVVSSVVLSHLSFHSSAYSSSTDSVSLSLPTSCTISANVLTPHNATLVNGQYEGNIGNTRINAYCNDNNGYFIYAIGSSNDTDGNTDLVSNINDSYNIHTNVYDSSTITANTSSSWAMKLTSSNGTYAPTIVDVYNNYNLIPSTDTIVAYRTSGTSMDLDTDLTGSYFNTTYEIYTNPIQPAGTYLGKVKYTMTHPYDASQLTTIEKAFDIAGKDKVQVTDPITGETGDYYKMQDMSSRICSLTTAYEIEEKLVDIRDNKLYYVSKLKDGHCWMTENLDLDINSSISFNSNNTDLNAAYNSSTGQYAEYNDGYVENDGIIYYTPASNATTIDFQNTGPIIGWQNSNTTPYSASKTDSAETGHASLGNYYNWTAAIASNNSSSLTQSTLSDISKNPKNSICPKGWRLPTVSSESESLAGSTNEFGRLNYIYNGGSTTTGDKLLLPPLQFVLSGSIGGGRLNYFPTNGTYWSSTNGSDSVAYSIFFDRNAIHLKEPYARFGGRLARCLAR